MGIGTRALNVLRPVWTSKIRGMKQLNQATSVRPLSPDQVIRVDESVNGEVAKLDCGPVVFNLCERAGAMPEMYVVVEGTIEVRAIRNGTNSLQTMSFATKVGYFRMKRKRLVHVYGVHYDLDEVSDSHPVFHAQLRPMKEFYQTVKEQFNLEAELDDCVTPILRNVRTPIAQMDFFSVCTQLCADHLVTSNPAGSNSKAVATLAAIKNACSSLQGAAHRFTHLSDSATANCYRSRHWYRN